MDFLQKQDLYSVIEPEDLEVVIDNDDTLLDQAEGIGIDEMIGYLQTRYDHEAIFTATQRNSLIVMKLSDIMLYHLHARKAPDNVPELRETRYEHALKWLKMVATGDINPILPKSETEENASSVLRFGSNPKFNHHY